MYKNIHVHLNFKVTSLAFLYVFFYLFSFTFVSEIERNKKKKERHKRQHEKIKQRLLFVMYESQLAKIRERKKKNIFMRWKNRLGFSPRYKELMSTNT